MDIGVNDVMWLKDFFSVDQLFVNIYV